MLLPGGKGGDHDSTRHGKCKGPVWDGPGYVRKEQGGQDGWSRETGKVLSRAWCERSWGPDHVGLTGHFKNTGFSLRNTRSPWRALI